MHDELEALKNDAALLNLLIGGEEPPVRIWQVPANGLHVVTTTPSPSGPKAALPMSASPLIQKWQARQ